MYAIRHGWGASASEEVGKQTQFALGNIDTHECDKVARTSEAMQHNTADIERPLSNTRTRMLSETDIPPSSQASTTPRKILQDAGSRLMSGGSLGSMEPQATQTQVLCCANNNTR